jgi:hypothetical protein
MVKQWEVSQLPRQQLKAYAIWSKSIRNNSRKWQMEAAQFRIQSLHNRLEKYRKEILSETWTRPE